MNSRALLLLLLLTSACTSEPTDEAPCDPTQDACPLTHAFGAYEIASGGEIDGVCMSWTVGNDEELWVNAVSTENDGFYHHSNWFFVPEDTYDAPDGHWNCWEQEFSEINATLAGGVLYAQSTQTQREEQRFRPGAAIRIPPRARIIAYTHLLNPTAQDEATEIRVRIETLRADEVRTVLTPFRLNYGALEIPPMSTSEFSSSCEFRELYESLMKRPFEMKLHWVLPHFHTLGEAFRLALVGGDRDGETIFELDEAYGEPLGHRFDDPFDVAGTDATGLRFTCGYENPRDDVVRFGIGDQEMCVMLGFAESAFLIDANVRESDGVTLGSDGVARGEGPCTVLGAPFQHAQ